VQLAEQGEDIVAELLLGSGRQSPPGMFAVDAGSTQGVAQVMKESNLPSKGVHGGGFDLLPRTVELIHEGFLDFTIDQQPYVQGFYPVVALTLKLRYGIAPSDIDAGAGIVDRRNVKQVMQLTTAGYR